MKKLIVGIFLAFSFSSLASIEESEAYVYPNVVNYGYSIQVQIWNTTDNVVRCSGYLNYRTDKGPESRFFTEIVSPRMNSYRMIYPNYLNSRILNVDHSIFCF